MRPNRNLLAAALASGLALAGCHRAPADAREETGTAAAPSGDGPDRAYVDRLLADTAFDYRQCDRSAALVDPERPGGADGDGGPLQVLVGIDSSGSMAAPAGTGTRMDEARAAVASFLAGLPAGTAGGVAAFGDAGGNRPADKAASCAAPAHLLAAPGPLDAGRIAAAVAGLHPAGWTPLAAAIRTLAGSFPGGGGRRLLYIVSDGAETCGGDPVAAAAAAQAGARVVVNVIGFGIASPDEARALQAVAAAGGGQYRSAGSGQLAAAMRDEGLLRATTRAINANALATSAAQVNGGQCYLSHMTAQATATMNRVNADQIAGRISAATAGAAARAQVARYDAAGRLLRRNSAELGAAAAGKDAAIGAAASRAPAQ